MNISAYGFIFSTLIYGLKVKKIWKTQCMEE